ncbi:hypothetical protein IX38_09755 [Chryseobacterium luteum]|uniref:Uncharacterized protein n=1 Tax=Chryseobacterium luteum TaxID=421531 RepID=A0A085ZTC2_9FLAO|nr:hypothetical protein IX38_09755 [Chryseobacterium luteum]
MQYHIVRISQNWIFTNPYVLSFITAFLNLKIKEAVLKSYLKKISFNWAAEKAKLKEKNEDFKLLQNSKRQRPVLINALQSYNK